MLPEMSLFISTNFSSVY